MYDKIIEVLVDGKGKIDYRLWPCGLDTRAYGTIFADLAHQVARMLRQEAGLDEQDTKDAIKEAFVSELSKPMSTMVGPGQLQ